MDFEFTLEIVPVLQQDLRQGRKRKFLIVKLLQIFDPLGNLLYYFYCRLFLQLV